MSQTYNKENSGDDPLSKNLRKLAIEKKKKRKKPKFKYEIKLWKLQLPELFWIIIGTIAQSTIYKNLLVIYKKKTVNNFI